MLELLKVLFNVAYYLTYNTVRVLYTLERELNETLSNFIEDKTETDIESKTDIEIKTYIEKNKLRCLYQECKYKKVLYSKKNNII